MPHLDFLYINFLTWQPNEWAILTIILIKNPSHFMASNNEHHFSFMQLWLVWHLGGVLWVWLQDSLGWGLLHMPLNSSETSRLSGLSLFMAMAEDQEDKTKCKRTFQSSPFVMSVHIPFAKAWHTSKSTRSLREAR